MTYSFEFVCHAKTDASVEGLRFEPSNKPGQIFVHPIIVCLVLHDYRSSIGALHYDQTNCTVKDYLRN